MCQGKWQIILKLFLIFFKIFHYCNVRLCTFHIPCRLSSESSVARIYFFNLDLVVLLLSVKSNLLIIVLAHKKKNIYLDIRHALKVWISTSCNHEMNAGFESMLVLMIDDDSLWLCFLFTVCCRFVILVPQNSLPTPQKCHLLEHIHGWHLRWLAFQFSLLLTRSILQKVFVEWFSIPAEVGYPHMKEMAMFIRKLK